MRHFCEIFKLCELAEAILISKTCISMSRSLKTLSMQNFKTWLFSKMPCASHTGTKVEFLSKNSVMVKTHFSQIYEIILKLKIQKSRFNFKLINFSLIFDPNWILYWFLSQCATWKEFQYFGVTAKRLQKALRIKKRRSRTNIWCSKKKF